MGQNDSRQIDWNTKLGNIWVDLQPMLDQLFLPFEQLLADAVMEQNTRHVLDIGCGTGATTLAIAKRLAPAGTCTGIDISKPMLNLAEKRAEAQGIMNAQFLAGDAQHYPFSRDAIDTVVSRFGVMFFDDPVEAFRNIGSAVHSRGSLISIVWRGRQENEFMTAAERAAGPLLGWPSQPDADAIGQFGFADAKRFEQVLIKAGWHSIQINPIDVSCTLSKADLSTYVRHLGRVGMALPNLQGALRSHVMAVLDEAFAEFVIDGTARFDVACWMVKAQAG